MYFPVGHIATPTFAKVGCIDVTLLYPKTDSKGVAGSRRHFVPAHASATWAGHPAGVGPWGRGRLSANTQAECSLNGFVYLSPNRSLHQRVPKSTCEGNASTLT